jgi:hypothetical protein
LKYDPQYVFTTDLPQLKDKKIEILNNATTTINKFLIEDSSTSNEILFCNNQRVINEEKQEIKSRLKLLSLPSSRKDVLIYKKLLIFV